MQSKAKTVSAYIKEIPENRRTAIKKLREMCLKILKDYSEDMEYGVTKKLAL